MIKNLTKKIYYSLNSRVYRRFFIFLLDILILIISIYFSKKLISSDNLVLNFWTYFNTILLGSLIYLLTNQYQSITKYLGSIVVYKIFAKNLLITAILGINLILFGNSNKLFNYLIIFYLLISFFIVSMRFIFRDILFSKTRKLNQKPKKIVIYGAGDAGFQLEASIRFSNQYIIKFFVDDNSNLWGRNINGIKIRSPDDINIFAQNIDHILLAIPSLTQNKRTIILNKLKNTGIETLLIPSLDDITSGRASINNLRRISINDLLPRDKIPQNTIQVKKVISSKTICIVGAGGSIGSELCAQILSFNPLKIILIEFSEPSLYKVNNDLKIRLGNKNIEILPLLGNACSENFIKNIFKKNKIDIVFHCAAYKHVPIVEANPLEGLFNNIVSTNVICSVAETFSCEKLIYISTDKAVRPTNVMGASKRVCELIVQAFNEKNLNKKTCFSMVRFGNVLDSSGSVLPLFKKQIENGGPITLTHENVYRYFMSIPEAAQLVLQAAYLANGGEVFLLEMGNPVPIKELAEKIILLSGLTIKNKENPNGDIEIRITGLRPGEKLREELLIDSKAEKTKHPHIFKAHESFLNHQELMALVSDLKKEIANQENDKSLKILKKIIPEWSSFQNKI